MCFGFLVNCVCLLCMFVCWFICFIMLLLLLVMFLILFWARPVGRAFFRCFVWVIFLFWFFGRFQARLGCSCGFVILGWCGECLYGYLLSFVFYKVLVYCMRF